jgi:hypothetical protein
MAELRSFLLVGLGTGLGIGLGFWLCCFFAGLSAASVLMGLTSSDAALLFPRRAISFWIRSYFRRLRKAMSSAQGAI